MLLFSIVLWAWNEESRDGKVGARSASPRPSRGSSFHAQSSILNTSGLTTNPQECVKGADYLNLVEWGPNPRPWGCESGVLSLSYAGVLWIQHSWVLSLLFKVILGGKRAQSNQRSHQPVCRGASSYLGGTIIINANEARLGNLATGKYLNRKMFQQENVPTGKCLNSKTEPSRPIPTWNDPIKEGKHLVETWCLDGMHLVFIKYAPGVLKVCTWCLEGVHLVFRRCAAGA